MPMLTFKLLDPELPANARLDTTSVPLQVALIVMGPWGVALAAMFIRKETVRVLLAGIVMDADAFDVMYV
jgi:hypothetical protein